ncbi:MAG: hypothetical protein ACI3T9_06760 [Romboutsia timonensis]
MKLIKEENELEKRAKFNKKHNKGLGWFVNPDVGNVEYNNAFFNAANNAMGSPSTNPTGPMAEDLNTDARFKSDIDTIMTKYNNVLEALS